MSEAEKRQVTAQQRVAHESSGIQDRVRNDQGTHALEAEKDPDQLKGKIQPRAA